MKTGRTLTEVAAELERQLNTKRDLIADTRCLSLVTEGDASRMIVESESFNVNSLAHDQIASRLNIPRVYYDRLRQQAPNLLDQNVNHWFNDKPERRMIRTIDGRLRAFLSDRYRPLDNYDLTEVILPIIAKLGCKVESCELTEKRFYIKAVNARIETEVQRGDLVQAGIVISNSEVGCGSVRIEPMVYRLVCLNGMIANDMSMKKYHVGRAGDDGSDVAEFYKDETRRADDRAFWLKVKDIVEGALTEAMFHQIVGKMRKASGLEIGLDPVKAVEVIGNRHSLSKDEQSNVIKFLVEGGDLSLYGMMNAVTRASQEVEDYDRATELERLGGVLLDTPELVGVKG